MTTAEQDKILDKINKITSMRIDLYQTLNEINKFYKNSLDNSNITLYEQKQAVSVLENNLNKTKKQKERLVKSKNNKIRRVYHSIFVVHYITNNINHLIKRGSAKT